MAKEIEVDETEVDETLETEELETEKTVEEVSPAARKQVAEEFARKIGWKDKKDYSGRDWDKNEKEWVDAETFLLRTPLPGHTVKLQRELSEVKQTLNYLKTHQDQRAQKEIQRLTDELSEARKQAILNSDVDEVDRLDKEIKDIKGSQGEDVGKSPDETMEDEWIEKNPWYDEESESYNPNLKKIAYGIYVLGRNDKLPTKQILKEIDETMSDIIKKPGKGKEDVTHPINPVETGQRRSGGGQHKVTFSELSDEEKTVCRTSVANGWFKNNQEFIDAHIKLKNERER